MSYFDDYKNRLNAKGTTIGEAYSNATVDLINHAFPNSPLYTIVPIDGVNTEVRILANKTSNTKLVIFRPMTKVDKGSIMLLEGVYWLVTDFDSNDIYPKAAIMKCNETLKWQDNVGVKEHPCVVTGFTPSFSFGVFQDRYMTLPTGELNIYVKYSAETLGLKLDTRLVFGTKVFKLVAADDITDVFRNKGMLKLYIKLDLVRDCDNFTTRIAENTVVNTGRKGGW